MPATQLVWMALVLALCQSVVMFCGIGLFYHPTTPAPELGWWGSLFFGIFAAVFLSAFFTVWWCLDFWWLRRVFNP